MAQIVTQLIVDASGAKTGVAEFTAAMDNAKRAAVDGGEATATSFERAQTRWTASLAKTDPVIKAQIAMEKDLARQREIGANAVKLGIASQDAAAAQLAKVSQQHQAYIATLQGASNATAELATAHKGLDSSGQAALHSIRSFAEQLALGVSPTQALTGQINHLTYAASGEGGLTGAFKQVGGVIGGFITPTNVAIAGVVALTAATVAAAVQLQNVQVSSQRAISGAGARTGTTVTDLNQFTAQNSGLSGTSLSAKEARSLAEEFTKTGDIVVSRLHGMSDAVVGFANQTGKSVDDAKKDFVAFAVDPQKALDQLSGTFGSFDVATRKAVDALVLADDKTGAFQVVIDAVSEKSHAAAESMGFLEKNTRAAVNAVKALATETVNPSGLENELAAAQAKLNDALSSHNDNAFATANTEKLRKNVDDLQAAIDKVNAQRAASELNKFSTAADAVDQSIVPQIGQIKQLEAELEKLNRAKEGGATSKFGSEVDNSAALAIANQIVKLQEAQDQTARYNQAVAEISLSWGNVSQSTALALQTAQNQLPVISAITGQEQMAAQYAADYSNALIAGQAPADALALAASKLEASEAAATASVEKQVQSLKDQNAMIVARQNGTEATTAAAIAYKNAINSGADASAAADLSAATLKNSMLQAADATGTMASNLQAGADDAAAMAEDAAAAAAYKGINFTPDIMPSGDHSFSADPRLGVAYSGGGGGQRLDLGTVYRDLSNVNPASTAAQYAGAGDYAGAIKAVESLANVGTRSGGGQFSVDDQISQVDTLTQVLNSKTSDKGTQTANLQSELAWLNTLPETIARDQKVISLTQSIDQLKSSTDGLNSTMQVSLNPLYNGRDALKVGYYKAASGLDFTAQGPSSGDQIPFHAMVNGGERIQITPAGQTSNDNSRTTQVTNNIVISDSSSSKRRSSRSLGQKYGQMMAALS